MPERRGRMGKAKLAVFAAFIAAGVLAAVALPTSKGD